MSDLYGLQRKAAAIEQLAKDVLRDLPKDTPRECRTQIEVIEAEARLLGAGADRLRSALRPLIDG